MRTNLIRIYERHRQICVEILIVGLSYYSSPDLAELII
jgi:hypothetical protein